MIDLCLTDERPSEGRISKLDVDLDLDFNFHIGRVGAMVVLMILMSSMSMSGESV